MKNNKGFTLIELLAVVAILAILAIIALPNVLEIYKNTRKNTFINEANNIIRIVKEQYFLDGAKAQVYTNVGEDTNELKMSGGSNIQYYIETNDAGEITKLQITNGTYQYENNEKVESVSSNEVDEISELDPDEVLVIGEDDSGGGSSLPGLPGHGH